jgi:hypothetical protein
MHVLKLMNLKTGFILTLTLSLLVAPGFDTDAYAQTMKKKPTTTPDPILVELFTSQGCSSCPAADRVLSNIQKLYPGVKIIPLAFHVDYWDRLGWRDPFSKAKWSERQRNYARRYWPDRVYTPQLVLDGQIHVVGSKRRSVVDGLRRVSQASQKRAMIQLTASRRHRHIDANIKINVTPETKESVNIYLAITESGLVTKIPRGENSGETLANDHVVRSLETLGQLAPADRRLSLRHSVYIPPAWNLSKLRLVVFAQTKQTDRILGIESLDLDASPPFP